VANPKDALGQAFATSAGKLSFAAAKWMPWRKKRWVNAVAAVGWGITSRSGRK